MILLHYRRLLKPQLGQSLRLSQLHVGGSLVRGFCGVICLSCCESMSVMFLYKRFYVVHAAVSDSYSMSVKDFIVVGVTVESVFQLVVRSCVRCSF